MPKTSAILCSILLQSSLLTLVGCSESKNPRADRVEQAVSVIAEPLISLPLTQTYQAIGTSRAQQTADLYARSAGEVNQVTFSAGDYVQKGEVLVRLDARREALELKQAQIDLAQATQLLTRYQKYEDTGAISVTDLEEAEVAKQTAEVSVDTARVALSDRSIRAPFSGYIGFSEVDPGDRITESSLIATLDNRSQLFVDFELPEQQLGSVKTGDQIKLTPSNQSLPIDARVRTAGTRVDSETRTYQVRAVLDNTADRFKPGMSFSIELQNQGVSLAAAAEESVVWGSDGPYVWTVVPASQLTASSDNRSKTSSEPASNVSYVAKRVDVEIVGRQGNRVLLAEPIKPGVLVIRRGVQKVREDQPVELTEALEPEKLSVDRRAPQAIAP